MEQDYKLDKIENLQQSIAKQVNDIQKLQR